MNPQIYELFRRSYKLAIFFLLYIFPPDLPHPFTLSKTIDDCGTIHLNLSGKIPQKTNYVEFSVNTKAGEKRVSKVSYVSHSFIHIWPYGKLFLNVEKFRKNAHFWQFCEKMASFLGNFLTFQWQFSRGSDSYDGFCLFVLTNRWYILTEILMSLTLLKTCFYLLFFSGI